MDSVITPALPSVQAKIMRDVLWYIAMRLIPRLAELSIIGIDSCSRYRLPLMLSVPLVLMSVKLLVHWAPDTLLSVSKTPGVHR